MIRLDNPFKTPEAIDNTRDEIAAVLAENMSRGLVAQEVGKHGLKNVVNKVTEERAASVGDSIGSFERIKNNGLKIEFHNTYIDTVGIFERIRLSHIPTIEEFEAAGVNFEHLAKEYVEMRDEGFEPQIVFAPHFGDSSPWEDLYRRLTHDPSIQHNSLKSVDMTLDGLYILPNAANAWVQIDRPPSPDEATTVDGEPLPIVTTHDTYWGGAVQWTARVFSMGGSLDAEPSSTHLTVSEYLTTQAVRAKKGQFLMDNGPGTMRYKAKTRLNGEDGSLTSTGIKRVPAATYIADGYIKIDMYADDDDSIHTRKVVG